MTTRHALEETRHRLISTSDLHLEKGRLLASAAFVWTLRLGFLRVIPGSRSAKDVLALLALKDTPRKDRVGDGVFVRACAALEAVCAVQRQGDGQDVCAVRTDCVAKSFGQIGQAKTRYAGGVWNHVLTEKHGCGCDSIVYAIFKSTLCLGRGIDQQDRFDVEDAMAVCARALSTTSGNSFRK